MDTPLRFDRFTIELQRGALLDGRKPLKLKRKSIEVLAVLVRESPDVVSRRNLMDEVWPDVHVTEAVLTNSIWELRSVLPSVWIQTHRGRGYSFVGPTPVPVQGPVASRRRVRPAAAMTCIAIVCSIFSGVPHRPLKTTPTSNAAAREKARAAFARAVSVAPLTEREPESLDWVRVAATTDPTFTVALVAMAELGASRRIRTASVLLEAIEAADRAVAHAPEWDRARVAKTWANFVADGDLDRVERELRETLKIAPESVVARVWLSWVLAAQGQTAEGREVANQALERSSPTDSRFPEAIRGLYLNRAFDDVIRWTEPTSAADSPLLAGSVPLYRALSYLGKGDISTSAEAANRVNAPSHWFPGDYGYLLGRLGRLDEVEQLLTESESRKRINPLEIAKLHLALGHDDEAIEYANVAIQTDPQGRILAASDPSLDPIRESITRPF